MPQEIITVMGAGIMGRGIAQVAASGGFQTRLVDLQPEVLEQARTAIQRNLLKGEELGKLPSGSTARVLSLLSATTDMENAAREADLIIEAVPESLRLKLDLFRQLDGFCQRHCIFASNTSALSITEMAAATGRADRFIGMHFFNPVHLMRLVEVVSGADTSAGTRRTAHEVAARMGKETVDVRESPGFVTTRMNALIGNEAFRMLESGIASAEDIDKALRLGLNHPMGPFELVDLVGLDTRLSILDYLHQHFGERYRPSELLVRYVREGRLGRKAGQGVYQYDKEGKRS